MTYCVALKSTEAVYLAADSAVTSAEDPTIERSSFGEKHGTYRGVSKGQYVQEQALKLYAMDRAAIAFAGDQVVGEQVVHRIRRLVAAGTDPLAALKEATAEATIADKAKFILAYLRDGVPTLAESIPTGVKVHKHDGSLVQIGSMNSAYHEITRKLVGAILERGSRSPKRMLAQVLAILQSYGMHDYLIEDGVGGGFCGLYLDGQGVHWQPDILYLIVHPQLESAGFVGSLVRDEVWCLFPSLTSHCLAFAHPLENESAEITRQRVSDVNRELSERHDSGVFDYAAILNIGKHIACVLELLGHHEHELIRIEPDPKNPGTLGVYWSPELQSKMDTIPQVEGLDGPPHDICLWFLPYAAPVTELPKEVREAMRAKPRNSQSSP